MKRRTFLERMGLASAGAASTALASNPASLFTSPVPADVVKQLKTGRDEATFKIQLIEIKDGRRCVPEDHDVQDLTLRGNVDQPQPNEVFHGDETSFYVNRSMTAIGVRVSGGEIGGRPWNAFAFFGSKVTLVAGNVLTVNYTLSVGDGDPMSPENINKPLRNLM